LSTLQKKVYAYLTYEGRLLVFRHTDYPEAGIQVPGGTVEREEAVLSAVCREVREETGLDDFRVVRKLGQITRDLADFGLTGLQERHYFHLTVDRFPGERWIAYEELPSDGTPGPIEFQFYWVPLSDLPALSGDLDEMLPELRLSLAG
jgi:8-oxo-dGTP pyrophosphatase MutT (NUDIX family)